MDAASHHVSVTLWRFTREMLMAKTIIETNCFQIISRNSQGSAS